MVRFVAVSRPSGLNSDCRANESGAAARDLGLFMWYRDGPDGAGQDNTSSYSLERLARARRLPAKSVCTIGLSSWAGKVASNASIC